MHIRNLVIAIAACTAPPLLCASEPPTVNFNGERLQMQKLERAPETYLLTPSCEPGQVCSNSLRIFLSHFHWGERELEASARVMMRTAEQRGKLVRAWVAKRTYSSPPQYFTVAVFRFADSVEARFTHYGLHDGYGRVLVYTHSTRGLQAEEEMSEWLTANIEAVQRAMLAFEPPSREAIGLPH